MRFDPNAPPLSVQFDQVNARHIDLEFEINELTLNPVQIDDDTYMQLKVPGAARLLQKGQPDLPVLARAVRIPSDGTVSYRYQVLEYEDVQDCAVAPSKGPISRAQSPANVPYSFSSTYYQSEGWPKAAVTVSEPYIIRNCRGVTVRLCPFQYFPATGILRVYRRVSVQVYCKGADGVNRLSASGAGGADPDSFQAIYANRFINYNTSSSSKRYTPLTRQGSMLIITADALASAVEPLAAWKRQRGIPTDVVGLSEIGSTGEDIKAYLQAAYDTNNLAYLLLVGDAEGMPSLMANTGEDRGESDPSYGKLAGSDDYPDIFVGRFSGSTPQQIAMMVERTIQYEQSPDPGATWYDYATGIASSESEDGMLDSEHMDNLRTGLLANGYATVDRIYDPGASQLQLAEAVNEGRGLINYVGHGDVKEWVTTGFHNTDINGLTNTAAWPFIFDVACVNGQFAGTTCFAEAWIQAEHEGKPAGALAIYASTINQDWSPPLTAQNEFARLLVAGDITGYGALCFNASMKMMDDWSTRGHAMFNTWTVFGDPSVQVRTKSPTTLSVSHSNAITSLGYPVHVNGVGGALAGLSSGGKYLGSAYTDANGYAVINLDAIPSSNALLTVTAFNAVPYTSVLMNSAAEMVYSPASFAERLNQGQSGSETLVVSNSGEASSILQYSINVVPEYSNRKNQALIPTADGRNLSGSTLTLNASKYTPGVRTELMVNLLNNSSDNEFISEAEMRFPTTVLVDGATALAEKSWKLVPDGSTGTGATVTWQAANVEMDSIEKEATGAVTLSFSPSAKGPLEIGWVLKGDSWGDAPHSVAGIITLEENGPPQPDLAVSAPNGGESWLVGSTQQVVWTSHNYTDTVDIDCSLDGGASWFSVGEGIANSGHYAWAIDLTEQSNNCLLRIAATDGSISVTSAAPFSTYHSLDWLTIDHSSGMISGKENDIVTLQFDASGKSQGTYRAVLEVVSNAGTSHIPVEMTALPPEDIRTGIIMTNDSGPVTLSSESDVQVFGSTNTNIVNIEAGARVQFFNFVGSNEINIDEAFSAFTVYRSGATVYLSSSAGTSIQIAANLTNQTLRFPGNNLELVISGGHVMLGKQIIE